MIGRFSWEIGVDWIHEEVNRFLFLKGIISKTDWNFDFYGLYIGIDTDSWVKERGKNEIDEKLEWVDLFTFNEAPLPTEFIFSQKAYLKANWWLEICLSKDNLQDSSKLPQMTKIRNDLCASKWMIGSRKWMAYILKCFSSSLFIILRLKRYLRSWARGCSQRQPLQDK